MKKYIVVGGLGFIGSHLVDALLSNPDPEISVCVFDNFSSGKLQHLAQCDHDKRLWIVRADATTFDISIRGAGIFKDADVVFMLSANPDARLGIADTKLDLFQEAVATRNILEAMRLEGAKKIVFSSSGTIYGDAKMEACREGFGERLPISLYGAGKLASEGLISAFCGTFGMSAVIFRFGNVVGERLTHGCIHDWMRQLEEHPKYLNVLGDGFQSKPYIYVKEIVDGLIFGSKMLDDVRAGFCEPFNIAPEDATSVKFIAESLTSAMVDDNGEGNAFRAVIKYGETAGGWAGDVPQSRMNMEKLNERGFMLGRTSNEAVVHAIKQILKTK